MSFTEFILNHPYIKNNDNVKKMRKRIKKVSKTKIRTLSNNIRKTFNISHIIIGSYYYYLHFLITCLISFVLYFTTNVYYLTILLIIVSLDAYSIIVLNDCPLSALEKKYLGLSCVESRLYFLSDFDIMYNNNNYYNMTIDLIVNAWCLITIKILFLLAMIIWKSDEFAYIFSKIRLYEAI